MATKTVMGVACLCMFRVHISVLLSVSSLSLLLVDSVISCTLLEVKELICQRAYLRWTLSLSLCTLRWEVMIIFLSYPPDLCDMDMSLFSLIHTHDKYWSHWQTVTVRCYAQFPAFSWVLSLWLCVCHVSVRAINRSTSGFPNAQVFCCCCYMNESESARRVTLPHLLASYKGGLLYVLTVYPAESWPARTCPQVQYCRSTLSVHPSVCDVEVLWSHILVSWKIISELISQRSLHHWSSPNGTPQMLV